MWDFHRVNYRKLDISQTAGQNNRQNTTHPNENDGRTTVMMVFRGATDVLSYLYVSAVCDWSARDMQF